MKMVFIMMSLVFAASMIPSEAICQKTDDPFLWLEEVESEKSMDWVLSRNNQTVSELKKYPAFGEIKADILDVLNSTERIAYPSIRGEYLYNYWQDEKNPRGIWRRTSMAQYFKNVPPWETVLDIDALCKKENEKWVYKGAAYLYPNNDLCMLNLSIGGSDAVVRREFNLKTKKFVKDGFFIPESKGQVSWIDENTLLVSTDYGKGSLTESGYPRITKVWKRGTELKDATMFYEGRVKDMGTWGFVSNTPERQYRGIQRMLSFYTFETYIEEDNKLIKLDLPLDCSFSGVFKGQMLLQPKSDWTVGGNTYQQGVLLSINYDAFLKGDRDFTTIFTPDERSSIVSFSTTKNFLLLNKLTNVKCELFKYTFENNKWKNKSVPAPEFGTIGITSTDQFSDNYFFTYNNFLNPSTLYFSPENGEIKKIKSLPDFFDGSKFQVEQIEIASKDGTMIPYFVVSAKNIKKDGSNPTLLYAYGGFEVSMQPGYSGKNGVAWLERGGVYVLANIRGGGEFGPKWHQAGLLEHRQRVFDDFYAVSEDLIKRKITSPRHLGIMGGSNGGLLVGVAYTQRPDLYNAVVCAVPLLDMNRYNKLLAGASWMAEYGNPDIPEQWEYIRKYSPYHNLFESKKYPKVLFTTTTRDDRVHPAHARKMAALMEKMGHPFFYFENTEGGHGSGVTNEQKAMMSALEYSYLHKMLQ
ncbi:S9 family peptidase [bacterium]|nr:S9 family peptidase [bacterium]